MLYARNLADVSELWLPPDPNSEKRYYKFKDEKHSERGPYRLKPLEASKSMDKRENLYYPIPTPSGGEAWPKRQWWWSKERAYRALELDELVFVESDDRVSVSYKQYLRDETGTQRGAKPFSVIDGFYTQNGTADLVALMAEPPVIQFPKPVGLLKTLTSIGTETDSDDIVLDFFGGSSTTAQAVLELNREDDGNRRFVMVQLPERTMEGSVAHEAGYRTVADIGKERIRRVIIKLQSEGDGKLPLETRATPEDLGFRVFKLAPSHWQPWREQAADASTGEYAQALALFHDPLVGDWRAEDVIHEVVLREGFSLTARIEVVEGLPGPIVWKVSDDDKEQAFYLCLDPGLTLATTNALGLTQDDLFICRDVALDDTEAANLALQCRLKLI